MSDAAGDGQSGHEVLRERAMAGAAALGDDGRWGLGYAPGRVTLIGDHTDYNGGLALTAALTRGCVCAVGWGDEPCLVAHACDLDETGRAPLGVGELEESVGELPSWMRYVAGVTALTMADLGIEPGQGLRCAVAADVPIGSGLSSSAAVEVSVATAIEALTGSSLGARKAALCQEAEHRFASSPCGLLDQLSSVHGRAGHALLIDFKARELSSIAMPVHAAFILVDSGMRHENADGRYATRLAMCESIAKTLGLASLGQLGEDELGRVTDQLEPEQLAIVRHVVRESARVTEFVEASRVGDLVGMGQLMNASHTSLSQDYGVSDTGVDALVETIRRDDAVLGARMTGAGFGGYVVALTVASESEACAGRLARACGPRAGAPSVIELGGGARVIEV